MRNSLPKFAHSGMLAIALTLTIPANAQDEPPITGSSELTPDQSATYDTWPPDQQVAYDTWPLETRGYYWSLAPDRQELFWRLSNEDRVLITAMTGPERESAWQSIEARAAGEGAAPAP
ncbi:MAG: hypothetical protein ABJP48_00695 [Erythrobacter sp.]